MRYPDRYGDAIEREAVRYGIDADLIRGVVWSESKFRPDAVSGKGAVGLMQLMPSTAAYCAEELGLVVTEEQLVQPETNLRLGVFYLNYLLEKFDEPYALAAYNAGEGKVSAWLAAGLRPETFPYKETRDYVRRIYAAQKVYRRRFALPYPPQAQCF